LPLGGRLTESGGSSMIVVASVVRYSCKIDQALQARVAARGCA